jgi:ATP-dependent helicase/nuclease subunit A
MKKNNLSKCRSSQVYIVEASAGSGKTYALATHYIRLLLDPSSTPKKIENILAITFTNKAAREMKERILDLLKKIALDKFADQEEEIRLISGLSINKKTAQEKSLKLMDYIIGNYNFFQVKTIDSFINMILLGCAYRLNLSANFKIKDNRRDYLAYSIDECINKANHDKKTRKLFDDFLNQYVYLKEKSSWFAKTDILGLMGALFYHANIYGGRFKKFDLKGKNIFQEKQKVLKLYKELSENLPEGVHGTFRKTIDNFVQKHSEKYDFGELKSKTLLGDEVQMRGAASVPTGVGRLWKQIRAMNSELAEKEASSLFNCYIDIFDLVYGAFREIASQDDVLFLEELNQQAHSLINENGITVPELYYQLASRLQHFLIDEFQDTSVLQWQNLYPMVVETLSTGGSLFYVGDKKQAIFRFRGGEVSLFDRIKDEFSAYVKEDSLKINYRSQKEIVEFNNFIFSRDNLQRFLIAQQPEDNELKRFSPEDINDILAVFSGSRQEHNKDGFHEQGRVKVELIAAFDKEERNELIKQKLLELIESFKKERRFDLKDIAVLCRDNAEVELISGWLIEGKIPVESDKTLNIKNNYIIKELLVFIRFLNSPIDNLSFSAFILGDMFQKVTGTENAKIKDFLFAIKEKTSRQQGFYIYREFRKVFPGIWDDFIEDFFRRTGFVSLYELTIDIYNKFRVFKNFPDQQGFFMHFLQIIKDSEEECQGITDFLVYLEELDNFRLYVNSSDVDALRVTTIHKAKGLGFGVIVIPFLEFNISHLGASDMKIKVSYAVEPADDGLALLRLDTKYAQLSPRIRQVYEKEYKNTFIDELNTVYVSLTRAKNELYIFIPEGSEKTRNIASLLIPQDRFTRGAGQVYKSQIKDSVASMLIEPPEYKDWNCTLKEEFGDLNALKNRQKILRGKIFHEILASIGNLVQEDKDKQLKVGLAKAGLLSSFSGDLSSLETIIRKLLEQKTARKFFYVADGMVFQEKEILDRFGATKRIDRLIVKENEIWIVDYKTKGDDAVDYKGQLDGYKEIIKEIYPGKIVRCFIIFLEEAKIEEINE